MPAISKAKLAKLEEATATVAWVSWFGTLPPGVLREGLIAGQTGHISFPFEIVLEDVRFRLLYLSVAAGKSKAVPQVFLHNAVENMLSGGTLFGLPDGLAAVINGSDHERITELSSFNKLTKELEKPLADVIAGLFAFVLTTNMDRQNKTPSPQVIAYEERVPTYYAVLEGTDLDAKAGLVLRGKLISLVNKTASG